MIKNTQLKQKYIPKKMKPNPNIVLGVNLLFFIMFSVTIVTALLVQFVIIGPTVSGT